MLCDISIFVFCFQQGSDVKAIMSRTSSEQSNLIVFGDLLIWLCSWNPLMTVLGILKSVCLIGK